MPASTRETCDRVDPIRIGELAGRLVAEPKPLVHLTKVVISRWRSRSSNEFCDIGKPDFSAAIVEWLSASGRYHERASLISVPTIPGEEKSCACAVARVEKRRSAI